VRELAASGFQGQKPLVKGSGANPLKLNVFLTFAKQNFSTRVKLYNMLEPGSMTMKNENEENSIILTSDYMQRV